MKIKLTIIFIMFSLFVTEQLFSINPGSLQKATIKVYTLKYSNDHNIKHIALSGDGKWVGIVYNWNSSGHHSKVTITDTAGSYGEITLLELDGEVSYIALNKDASKVVVVGSFSSKQRAYIIDTGTKAATYFDLKSTDDTFDPEANFDYNTLTVCGRRFEYSDPIYYLASYDLNSGKILKYIEGDKKGTSCSFPYRMADGGFVFMSNGIKYLSASAASLEDAQLITNKSDIRNVDIGNNMLVETSCKSVYYYHPLLSEKRLIFTDDSDFSSNNSCTMNWLEMGLNSQYTFAGDKEGLYIVQIYGENFPQHGRYFTGEDVTGISERTYLYPAGWNNVNRERHVSLDGKRIVVQAGKSFYDEKLYKLYVIEVTGSEKGQNNNENNNTSNNCSASFYQKDGKYFLNIPVAKYNNFYYLLTFQYIPSSDKNLYFVISDYSNLSSNSSNNCDISTISSSIDITIPEILFQQSGKTYHFSAIMSVYNWNNGLFYLHNVKVK